ncbi:hypothetical protein DLAC_03291 [Tieghemostelium lacteum]|uniref:Phospholipase/carboxylesterase/thioesterase domain-containing protein n=1 Tax=Tieghemostelium lacteum TaxID=361077 RepID=A0A152A1Q0_TIELA|nr:hypothetical protein DLAC_03291 [Tieghemostelium lacteum]|eukprot:KYR00140.1 hypothetical protein DLAC_03291 [Tieghemostelium lacteum]
MKLLIIFSFLYLINYSFSLTQTTESYLRGSSSVYFLQYLPPNYGNGTPAPVIIFLHGADQGGNTESSLQNVKAHGIPQYINDNTWPISFPFIVISPQVWSGWATAPDVQGIMNILVARHGANVDMSRVYLTGLSAGGIGSLLYAGSSLTAANSLAAIVTVCHAGNFANDQQALNIVNSHLPIWSFIGSLDSWLTDGLRVKNKLISLGMTPPQIFTEYPGLGHSIWDQTYNPLPNNPYNIYSWMLQFTNVRSSSTTSAASTTSTTSAAVSTTGPTTTTATPTTTTTSSSTTGTVAFGTFTKKSRPSYGLWEYIPSFSNNNKYPVIVFLHGFDAYGTGSTTDLDKITTQSLPKLIKDQVWPSSYPFLVLAPQTNQGNWDNSVAVFDDLMLNYSSIIDTTRIYVTGQGRGAVGAQRLFSTSTRASTIAAVHMVRIFESVSTINANNMDSQSVPTWFYTNQDDPNVDPSYQSAWVNYLNSQAIVPAPKVTLNPTGGVNSFTTAYAVSNPSSLNLYTWLLQYTSANRGVITPYTTSTTSTSTSTSISTIASSTTISTTSTTGAAPTTTTTGTTSAATTTTTSSSGGNTNSQTSKSFVKTQWGHMMYYLEYLPQGYGNGTKFPILIFLHGSGQKAAPAIGNLQIIRNAADATIPYLIENNLWPQNFPFIVLSPQTEFWWSAPEVDAAVRLGQSYSQHGDQTRIYLTGVSMGGGGVWKYASDSLSNANLLAAIVPISSANVPETTDPFSSFILSHIPIWAFHDKNDPSVDKHFTTDWINGISSMSPPPIYTETNLNIHNIWNSIYIPNASTNPYYIYDWLLSKTNQR